MEKPSRRTFLDACEQFASSRIDVGVNAQKTYKNAKLRVAKLGSLVPEEMKPEHFRTWIADNDGLAASTLAQYLSTYRQVLDHCDIEPNPARSAKVKLPKSVGEEVAPPSHDEWIAMQENVAKRTLLLVRFIEAEAVRISEALQLTYGDIDFAGGRVRISKARTKGRTSGQRWLATPSEILDEISELVPLEDRHRDRRVWPDLTDNVVRGDLYRACRDSGMASYSPHDLRDRRISLWIAQGIDAVQAKTWSGHTKASMTLDVYAHVTIDPNADEHRDFWQEAYARRSPGRVPE